MYGDVQRYGYWMMTIGFQSLTLVLCKWTSCELAIVIFGSCFVAS